MYSRGLPGLDLVGENVPNPGETGGPSEGGLVGGREMGRRNWLRNWEKGDRERANKWSLKKRKVIKYTIFQAQNVILVEIAFPSSPVGNVLSGKKNTRK